MAKQLVVINGKDKGRTFPLPESGSFTVGRATTSDTRLTDVRVSRTHCELKVDGDQLLIIDKESAVGTFVNDQRVGSSQPLQAGDVIRIGDTEMRLEDEDLAMQATVAGILPQELQQTLQRHVATKTAGPLTDLVGSVLGHYELIGLLSRGQSSMIFRGQDTTEARLAAIKVLQPSSSRSDGEMQRLTRILESVRSIRHENIISLFDVGKDRGFCWFALELVEGENLSQMLQRTGLAGMLNWDHVLRIGIHVTKGLVELHKHHILHRNVTPRAIIINNSDKLAKLGGLWLAKPFDAPDADDPARLTESRDLAFLPPEQHSGAKRDERADLYSLGATLYTLLTGRPPFEGRTIPEMVIKVLQSQPARPRDFQLSLPAAFENLVLQLLAKKPQDRYATAAAVLAELERIAADPTGSGGAPRKNGTATTPMMEEADGVIPVVCSCGQRLQARKKCAGTQVRCPTCGNFLLVPGQPASVGQVVLPSTPPTQPMQHAPTMPVSMPDPPSTPAWHAGPRASPVRNSRARVIGAAVGAVVVLVSVLWSMGLVGGNKPTPTGPQPTATATDRK
jgi:serine/threonine protein kinase